MWLCLTSLSGQGSNSLRVQTLPPTIRVPTIAIFIILVGIIIMIDFEQVFFLLAQTFFILRNKMFKVLLVTVIKGLKFDEFLK